MKIATKKRLDREFHSSIMDQQNGLECREVFVGRNSITPRYGHASCISQGSMFVFGGCTGQMTLFNDLWKLDLSTRTWSRPVAGGSFPPPKSQAVMVAFENKLLVHGGQTLLRHSSLRTDKLSLFDDIHEFDTESNEWRLMLSKNQGPKLSGHSCCLLRSKSALIVFGGLTLTDPANNTIVPSNEVWFFDTSSLTWSLIRRHNPGIVPPPRFGHSMITLDDDNTLMILGGCGENRVYLNDVWLLKMISHQECIWTPIIVRPAPDTVYPFGPQIHLNPVCKVNPTSLLVINIRSGQEQGLLPGENGRRGSTIIFNFLDIQSVKQTGFIRWRNPSSRSSSSPVEDIALYSLLLGKNEIIMFGGTSLRLSSAVTNGLFFISCRKQVT